MRQQNTMVVVDQDDETFVLDATHVDCPECQELQQLVTSFDDQDTECENDPGHGVEPFCVSKEPVRSAEQDADYYNHGRAQYEYPLERA